MNQPKYETSHQMGSYPKIVIFLLLSVFPICGIVLLMLGIYTVIVDDGYLLWPMLLWFSVVVCISGGFLSLGWAFISSGLARYCFEKEGLIAEYPLRKPILIPWEDFQQVCILNTAFTTVGERRANTVICCVKKGEKKNGYGRWKTDNPFRYRSVICIDYQPELYEGLIERCPYEVIDIREL